MEILTYVLEGAVVAHRDSTGTGRRAAGRAAADDRRHRRSPLEFHASPTEPLHLLQIRRCRISRTSIPATNKSASATTSSRASSASPTTWYRGCDPPSIKMPRSMQPNSASRLVNAHPRQGPAGRVHLARGQVRMNGQLLAAGDGVAVTDETKLTLEGIDHGEKALLFDSA